MCRTVVVAVTFQQVDCAPDAEAGTECYYESLKNTNSRIEKCHKVFAETNGIDSRKSRFKCKSRNENCDAAPDSGVSFQLFNFNDPFRLCKRGCVFDRLYI